MLCGFWYSVLLTMLLHILLVVDYRISLPEHIIAFNVCKYTNIAISKYTLYTSLVYAPKRHINIDS